MKIKLLPVNKKHFSNYQSYFYVKEIIYYKDLNSEPNLYHYFLFRYDQIREHEA